MIKQILITNVVDTPDKVFGFARALEDAAHVFIPPVVVKENDLQKGDIVYAELVENRTDITTSAGWRVNMIYDENGPFAHLLKKFKVDTNAEPVEPSVPVVRQEPSFEQVTHAILHFMSAGGDLNRQNFYTTGEMSKLVSEKLEFEIKSQRMGRILSEMHTQHHSVARMAMYGSPDQERASGVVWCLKSSCNEIFDAYFGEND